MYRTFDIGKIEIREVELISMRADELLKMAYQARKNAYAPYSGFTVGAALLSKSGKIYTGCNIENASYGASNCAERTAFFKAVSEGEREFDAIAVAGGAGEERECAACAPCGICRQVMTEFCNPETFQIYLDAGAGQVTSYLLKDLLPAGFGAGNLKK